VKRARVRSAVTEEGDSDAFLAIHLRGKASAGYD
jgi:hypothetical protein